MAELIPVPKIQFFDANGNPLPGGKIYSYASGTMTTLATYADAAALVPNPNPVVLDAGGWASVFLGPSNYTIQVKTAAEVTVYTQDNVRNLAQLLQANLSGSGGAAMVGFLQAGTGAVARDMQGKAREHFSVEDFDAIGNGVVDDTVAFNKALAAAEAAGGGAVLVPAGQYKISNRLTVPAGVLLYGQGRYSKLVSAIPNGLTEMVRLAGDYAAIEKLWLHGTGQQSVPTACNGSRGIWIGNSPDYLTAGITYYNRVADCIIDHFVGNGISGDYQQAQIIHNVIVDNTDANLFLQTHSCFNLIQGNTLCRSRYSGIDCIGHGNRIIANICNNNGGGDQDPYSHCGILINYVQAPAGFQPSGSLNQLIGNYCDGNVGWGILVNNGTPAATGASAAVHAPFGNIIKGNVLTNHVTQYNENPNVPLFFSWNGGLVIFGAEDTLIADNVSANNTFNYVVVGTVGENPPGTFIGNSCIGTVLKGNISLNAVPNLALATYSPPLPSGVGFFFPSSARLDSLGGTPVTDAILIGNSDRYPATDSFQWYKGAATALLWSGWQIDGNHSYGAGEYGFNQANPFTFGGNWLGQNHAVHAGTAAFNGWSTYAGQGLGANTGVPSVANARVWLTQNSVPTTFTHFLDGCPGQEILIRVTDIYSTFNFTSGNLRGNFGTSYNAVNGDALLCVFDGDNWQCDLLHRGPACVFVNVNQVGTKASPVTQNALSGRITMCVDAIGIQNSGGTVSFHLINDRFTSGRDFVLCTIAGGDDAGKYSLFAGDAGPNDILFTVGNHDVSTVRDPALIIDYEIRKR